MSATSTTTDTAGTTGKPAVAVIGLGNLGQVLAERFLGHGHPTTVWNRSPAKADALVARGATRAGTAAEAVAGAELVVVALLDHDAARDVLASAGDALAGRSLLNVTTGTPGPTRELAAWVRDWGAEYLDGAVYAVPQTIGTAEAFVLYSGSRTAFETHRAALDLLGTSTFVGTEPELASVYDIALLSGMYGMFSGFFQAVALGDTAGIGAGRITELLVPWLNATAAALPEFAASIDSGDYATETSNMDINAVGLANILRATEAQGVPTDLLTPLQALFDRQIEEGHGAASLARTIESLRKPRA
ncbi:NAD(P)-dependent oxidoreductase [Allostreptomyces psammosilenae]|uniref:3-hydroxyisobutyrate dehydrogenase-like beta-hydroxyacid dehydrogenase n=1 Tax=Allostreptomyces psammosilenae TaxID=1892865 RepID=A0A853A4V0_9ACTN|nr:NAD(P)-binding domain-containing protein [Allostreptomyces psammosilenae]NYI05522.1 3-hydroxyisobutyrate dehydrogenase-like beta-hydroxyacid dehydrogenase [Allostreptomyces psammosilenae]